MYYLSCNSVEATPPAAKPNTLQYLLNNAAITMMPYGTSSTTRTSTVRTLSTGLNTSEDFHWRDRAVRGIGCSQPLLSPRAHHRFPPYSVAFDRAYDCHTAEIFTPCTRVDRHFHRNAAISSGAMPHERAHAHLLSPHSHDRHVVRDIDL